MSANIEKLTPDTVSEALKTRLEELIEIEKELRKQLKNAPAGAIRVSRSNNRIQFYHYTSKFNTNGVFLKKSQLDLIQKLAQKAYNIKVLAKIKMQIKLIKSMRNSYNDLSIEKVFQKQSVIRQNLINPLTFPDERFINIWTNKKFSGKAFHDNAQEFYTSTGLRVRSKSEILIAETLQKNNIPFRYEFPVNLKNRITVHPDFYCLNVKTRKEYLWEHFGMLNDPNYATKCVKKLKMYADSGFFAGKNMIITTESPEIPLNTAIISKFIAEYLK